MTEVIVRQRSVALDLVLGFIAGALAVLIFHQLVILLLGQFGLARGAAYSMSPVAPFGVPRLVNQMFWGGVWGIVFAAIYDRLPSWNLVVTGLLFGLIGPTLFGWVVMALIRGQPMFAGFVPGRMLVSVLLNGVAFGIGLALIFAGLRRLTAGPG
jgi:hypothetical protein